jgi:hypothetical protein
MYFLFLGTAANNATGKLLAHKLFIISRTGGLLWLVNDLKCSQVGGDGHVDPLPLNVKVQHTSGCLQLERVFLCHTK